VRFALSFVQLVFSVLYVFYWFELKLWYIPEPLATHAPEEGPAEEEA